MALRPATPVAATTPLGCGTRHQVQCIRTSSGCACKSANLRSSRARIFMKGHSDSYDIHISGRLGPSRFFMTFGPILRVRSHNIRPLFRWRWCHVAQCKTRGPPRSVDRAASACAGAHRRSHLQCRRAFRNANLLCGNRAPGGSL